MLLRRARKLGPADGCVWPCGRGRLARGFWFWSAQHTGHSTPSLSPAAFDFVW